MAGRDTTEELREAVCEALTAGGMHLLRSPQAFYGSLGDVTRTTTPEMRLLRGALAKGEDATLLEGLAALTRGSSAADVKAAAGRIERRLIDVYVSDATAASSCARGLSEGVARYLGIAVSGTKSSGSTKSSGDTKSSGSTKSSGDTKSPGGKRTTGGAKSTGAKTTTSRRTKTTSGSGQTKATTTGASKQTQQTQSNDWSGLLFIIVAIGVVAWFLFGPGTSVFDDSDSSSSYVSSTTSTSTTSTSSPTISSANEACNRVRQYLSSTGQEIPPIIEFDHMKGDSYVIHGYEEVDDGGGYSHTSTWFWYSVSPDGVIYDEMTSAILSV